MDADIDRRLTAVERWVAELADIVTRAGLGEAGVSADSQSEIKPADAPAVDGPDAATTYRVSWYQVSQAGVPVADPSPYIRYWTRRGWWNPPYDMRQDGPGWMWWDDFTEYYWNGQEFSESKRTLGTWREVNNSGEPCDPPTPLIRFWDGEDFFGYMHDMSEERDRVWFQWNDGFDRFWNGERWLESRPAHWSQEDPHLAYIRGSVPKSSSHRASGSTTPMRWRTARRLPTPRLKVGLRTLRAGSQHRRKRELRARGVDLAPVAVLPLRKSD